jgi:hypothetical protein
MPWRQIVQDKKLGESDLTAIIEDYFTGHENKKISLSIDDLKRKLNIGEQDALALFEMVSIFANITKVTGKVPVKTSDKSIEWISYGEAEVMVNKNLAQKFFSRKANDRLPKKILDAKFRGELRKDIREKIRGEG